MKKILPVSIAIFLLTGCYDIMPRNNINDCVTQCKNNKKPKACRVFCDSIHLYGRPLNTCLKDYEKASE